MAISFTESSGVVGGDYGGQFVGAVAANYSAVGGPVGANYDSKAGTWTGYAYTARFEVELPAVQAVEIWAARLTVRITAQTGNANKQVRGGWLKTDGKWNQTGFNSANYLNRSDVPTVAKGAGIFEGNAFAFDSPKTVNVSGTMVNTFRSFGEYNSSVGFISYNEQLPNLYQQLDEFVNGSPLSDRQYSASGTALPVAFTWGPWLTPSVAGYFTLATVDHTTASYRPLLEVWGRYEQPSGAIKAFASVSRSVSGQTSVGKSVDGTTWTGAAASNSTATVAAAVTGSVTAEGQTAADVVLNPDE